VTDLHKVHADEVLSAQGASRSNGARPEVADASQVAVRRGVRFVPCWTALTAARPPRIAPSYAVVAWLPFVASLPVVAIIGLVLPA
jgi:hypothetical protein